MVGKEVGGYLLTDLLYSGTFASVYRGHLAEHNLYVAIKIYESKLPAHIKRLAMRESMISASLDHPHLVPIYNFGTSPDLAYFVTKYIDGQSLAKRILDSPLSVEEIAKIISVILRTVEYLHQNDIAHGDLEPHNILINTVRVPYLIDFSASATPLYFESSREANNIPRSLFTATPEYAAPERILVNSHPTQLSDIYSLGVLIYEMFTGNNPFRTISEESVLEHCIWEPLPSLMVSRSDIVSEFDAVISTATAQHPQNRYPSVRHLKTAFDAAVILNESV